MSDQFVLNRNAYPLSNISNLLRARIGLSGARPTPATGGLLGHAGGYIGHEVHRRSCPHGPAAHNAIDIGWHFSSLGAVSYSHSVLAPGALIDGCFHCCPETHKF